MLTIHSRCYFFCMLVGVQLVFMALLTREGNQKSFSYIIHIFRKDPTLRGNHTAVNITGEDVIANSSHLSKASSNGKDMPTCPETSPLLQGPIHVSFPPELVLAEVQEKNPMVLNGGEYKPPDCEARHKTAIIIPHRYREHHLKYLLYYLHPFLQRQQLHYKIYLVHQGPIHVSFPPELGFADVQEKNPMVLNGGEYKPPDCEATHKTAIIIPHRYREHHLKYLLYYLHPFLQRQQLQYKIYLVHQAGSYTFNKAMLMNAGFLEAMKEEAWDCIYFHDVDLIPEDDRNIYVCNSNPKHSAIAIDKFNYELPYLAIFGGVTAMTPAQFHKINGFPNTYWGWGGEDDDIGRRVSLAGMQITRPSMKVGRYKMIKHNLDKGNNVNEKRFNSLANTHQTWKSDGMNTAVYEVLTREYLPLYTNITVHIGTEAGLHPPS